MTIEAAMACCPTRRHWQTDPTGVDDLRVERGDSLIAEEVLLRMRGRRYLPGVLARDDLPGGSNSGGCKPTLLL